MLSDAAGLGGFSFPIPPTPSIAGAELHAQAIWPWSPAACQPTSWGWSSSDGLTITLQP